MKYKYILGFQTYASHDSGASIIKFIENQKPEFIAISEERLSRKKHNYDFPLLSIKYCMDHFNIKKFSDIDCIVTDWIRLERWERSGPGYSWSLFDIYKEYLAFDKKKIFIINHHLAHAASVYYTSKFKESSILIVDGNGSDLETNSYYYGINNKIKLLEKYKGYGIGEVYSSVTREILGLGTGGEGKTMGLAPYGKYNFKIKIPYKLQGIKTDFSNFIKRLPNSDYHSQKKKPNRKQLFFNIKKSNEKNIMKTPYVDWAYAVQKLAEKTMVHLGNDIYKKTKSKNLCIAGGVALNCIANEKIAKKTKNKKIHIFPACSDAGVPFGLVIWGYHNIYNQTKRVKFENAYTGKKYKKEDIKLLLKKFKIIFNKTKPSMIAKLLSKNKILGIFQGRSEYGPRALGNRSIIANPTASWMRDHINTSIKHRELFRPFAPIVLKKYSKFFFDVEDSPYMLRAGPCKKYKIIPAVNHIDQTSRVQTITIKQNKNIYEIIKNFKKIAGIPVILNTSFNDAGEPLVENPVDALISFINTNLDYLVLEDFSIDSSKLKYKESLLRKLINYRIKETNKLYSNAKKTLLNINFSSGHLKEVIKKRNESLLKTLGKEKIENFKNFFTSIEKNKKYLIIGTRDHTNKLFKLFKKFKNRYQNVYFYEFKKNDYKNSEKNNLKKINRIIKFDTFIWSNILISSHQFQDEIRNFLYQRGIFNFDGSYKNFQTNILDSY
jgi:carbamoyltransferase